MKEIFQRFADKLFPAKKGEQKGETKGGGQVSSLNKLFAAALAFTVASPAISHAANNIPEGFEKCHAEDDKGQVDVRNLKGKGVLAGYNIHGRSDLLCNFGDVIGYKLKNGDNAQGYPVIIPGKGKFLASRKSLFPSNIGGNGNRTASAETRSGGSPCVISNPSESAYLRDIHSDRELEVVKNGTTGMCIKKYPNPNGSGPERWEVQLPNGKTGGVSEKSVQIIRGNTIPVASANTQSLASMKIAQSSEQDLTETRNCIAHDSERGMVSLREKAIQGKEKIILKNISGATGSCSIDSNYTISPEGYERVHFQGTHNGKQVSGYIAKRSAESLGDEPRKAKDDSKKTITAEDIAAPNYDKETPTTDRMEIIEQAIVEGRKLREAEERATKKSAPQQGQEGEISTEQPASGSKFDNFMNVFTTLNPSVGVENNQYGTTAKIEAIKSLGEGKFAIGVSGNMGAFTEFVLAAGGIVEYNGGNQIIISGLVGKRSGLNFSEGGHNIEGEQTFAAGRVKVEINKNILKAIGIDIMSTSGSGEIKGNKRIQIEGSDFFKVLEWAGNKTIDGVVFAEISLYKSDSGEFIIVPEGGVGKSEFSNGDTENKAIYGGRLVHQSDRHALHAGVRKTGEDTKLSVGGQGKQMIGDACAQGQIEVGKGTESGTSVSIKAGFREEKSGCVKNNSKSGTKADIQRELSNFMRDIGQQSAEKPLGKLAKPKNNTILPENVAATISMGTVPALSVGEVASWTFTAEDQDGINGVTTNLEGATVSHVGENTYEINFTPTVNGVVNYTISVLDNRGGTTTGNFNITVGGGAPVENAAPVISTTTLPKGRAGTFYLTYLAGTDAEGNTKVWGAEGLPSGLTLDGNTGVISGTPTAAGIHNVTITLNDGHHSIPTRRVLTLNIEAAARTLASPTIEPGSFDGLLNIRNGGDLGGMSNTQIHVVDTVSGRERIYGATSYEIAPTPGVTYRIFTTGADVSTGSTITSPTRTLTKSALTGAVVIE